jgi:hypothetical protein
VRSGGSFHNLGRKKKKIIIIIIIIIKSITILILMTIIIIIFKKKKKKTWIGSNGTSLSEDVVKEGIATEQCARASGRGTHLSVLRADSPLGWRKPCNTLLPDRRYSFCDTCLCRASCRAALPPLSA